MLCIARRRRRTLAGLLAVAASLSGGIAYARDCARDPRGAGPVPPAVLVVMDASRSMAAPAGAGRSRLEVAKAALGELVDGLPDDARVGLRLYGHRVAGATRAAGCRDTELVTPVGPLDRAALRSEIGSYRAVGSTPIGTALRAAAADLPAAGASSIVLVSDGGDNCAPPDPCGVAERLAAERDGLGIQVIGFQVSARAQRQLRCIARSGRGVYRDAADADELAVTLRALAARAMRRYRPTGRPVAGGTRRASAPTIGSGRFVDRIGADEERWYAVTLGTGQRLAAAAVVSRLCPFAEGLADMIGTSLSLDVFEPDDLPGQGSAVANLFVGDESTESDGILTPVVRPRADTTSFTRPGNYALRVAFVDNGNGKLADALAGGTLPLQIQTRIAGRTPSVAPRAPRAPAPAATGAGGAGTAALLAALLGCLVLGAIAAFTVAVRRGRRG